MYVLQAMVEDEAKYVAAWAAVKEAHGVVIPGGFGLRGVEGKIEAARYCREKKKPFLGICLGMQVRCCCQHRSLTDWEYATVCTEN